MGFWISNISNANLHDAAGNHGDERWYGGIHICKRKIVHCQVQILFDCDHRNICHVLSTFCEHRLRSHRSLLGKYYWHGLEDLSDLDSRDKESYSTVGFLATCEASDWLCYLDDFPFRIGTQGNELTSQEVYGTCLDLPHWRSTFCC